MSKEIMEKKLYPSQINSKTISARIPVQDYVNFLNESINLGISLNDFLLRKIYNNTNNVGSVNKENNISTEISNFINEYEFELVELDNPEEYWSVDKENYPHYNNPVKTDNIVRLLVNSEGAGNYFYTLQHMVDHIKYMDKHIREIKFNKTPNLMDIKVQIRSLVRSKIHRNDQDEYLKEINRLLRELE